MHHDPGEARNARVRGARRRVTSVVLVAGLMFGSRVARPAEGEEERTRGQWAAVLVTYGVLGALTVGSAYVMRDNLIGRSVAVGAASTGGLVLGAAGGFGLARLQPCTTGDCETEEAVPVLLGGLLGAAAGGLAATFLTSTPGMSRPTVAAAGMAPGLLFLGMGTIARW